MLSLKFYYAAPLGRSSMAEAPAKAPPAGNLRRFGSPWTQGCWHTGRKLNYICSMMLDIIPRRHSVVTRSRCLPRALNAAVPGLGAALGLWAMPHLGPGCGSPREDHRSKASSLVRVGAARGCRERPLTMGSDRRGSQLSSRLKGKWQ